MKPIKMENEYQRINIIDVEKLFKINKEGYKYTLSLKNCPNKVTIALPFILDERIATLAGMMPDGSLIKDKRRLYFVQKKDYSKHILFENIIKDLFSPNNKIFMKNTTGALESYLNSTVLGLSQLNVIFKY